MPPSSFGLHTVMPVQLDSVCLAVLPPRPLSMHGSCSSLHRAHLPCARPSLCPISLSSSSSEPQAKVLASTDEPHDGARRLWQVGSADGKMPWHVTDGMTTSADGALGALSVTVDDDIGDLVAAMQ